jgi:hypothetical protein
VPGQFKGEESVLPCHDCEAGWVAEVDGATECVQCDGLDWYQPDEGMDACVPTLECTSVQFETVAPTPSTNRQCQDHYECADDEFETRNGNATHDRVCQAHTVCAITEHETRAAGTHQDRLCEAHTICQQKEWEYVYEGTHNDRTCEIRQPCHHTTCQLHHGKIRVMHHHKDHEYGFSHHHCKMDADMNDCTCMCHNQELDNTFAYAPEERFFWKREVKNMSGIQRSSTSCPGTIYSPSGLSTPGNTSLCRNYTLGQELVVSDGSPFVPMGEDAFAQASSLVVFANDRVSWAGADTSCDDYEAAEPVTQEVEVFTCVLDTCPHPTCCDCGNPYCSEGHGSGMCAEFDTARVVAPTVTDHPDEHFNHDAHDATSEDERFSGAPPGTEDTLYPYLQEAAP